MDEADPEPVGIVHGTDRHRLTEDLDSALIRLVQSAEHLHQGRFASTVLTDQRDYLARVDLEFDRVQGPDAGKLLGDSRHPQDWRFLFFETHRA